MNLTGPHLLNFTVNGLLDEPRQVTDSKIRAPVYDQSITSEAIGQPRMKYVPDDYYSILARENEHSPFLSPSQSPEYAKAVAAWLCGSEAPSPVLVEVGPGYGEIVSMLGPLLRKREELWLVDSCSEFLNISSRRLIGPHSQLKLLQMNIESCDRSKQCLLEGRVHRLAAINVMQDVDATTVLEHFCKWMAAGGCVWLTFLAKETMDIYYSGHPLYDLAAGMYYKPRTASRNFLGKRATTNGLIKYERILRFHTRDSVIQALETLGFTLLSLRDICYSAEDMLSRWQQAGTLQMFSSDALSALWEAGSYTDAYEVVACWNQ
jgi:hypothetical protein